MKNLWKKLIGWTLCLMMAVGMLPVAAREAKAAETDAGAGEGIVWNAEENRYEISSYAGLLEFAKIVNGKPSQFGTNSAANAKIVVKEIDASASNPTSSDYDGQTTAWTPIGSTSSDYTGTFDGNGCTITGLTIESTNDYIGLFGHVGEGGCVQNVNLEGGSIKGKELVGGVAGFIYKGKVSNCYNAGAVRSESGFVGGVAGFNDGGTVLNCYNTGAVSGRDNVGGVAGANDGGTVLNCYNTGAVEGHYQVGGVVGFNNKGIVTNCYNTGAVEGNYQVGGVVGYNYVRDVTNCYNTGDVEGNSNVGGVAGDNRGGTVSNCYNTGDVEGSLDYVGGVAGWNSTDGTVSNCYNTGDVRSESESGTSVGGVAGYNSYGTVSNCYNTGDVEGNIDVGGVAGHNRGTVSNCYNTGDVEGNSDVGAVAGYNEDSGEVSNCYYNQSICQKGAIGVGNSGTNVTGLTTLQMIGTSSDLHDSLVSITDDKGNHVWLFRRNIDGTYYYPHLAGFNFDQSGNQLAADGILANEWPGKGTFSFALSDYQFTYTGEIIKAEVGKVTFDNDEMTEYRVKYLDSENNEVEPKKAGVYRACVYWEEAGSSYLEGDFKILSIRAILTADSASAECDGTTLIKNSYTISGLAEGDSVESVTITGSQTGPGSSDNVPSAAKIVNADGEDVTGCYDITYVNGKLTVSEHSFDKEVADAKYQKSEADCTHAAVYYKSCKCGEKGTETFESGEPLGHGYKAVEGTAVAPTCEKPGKEADQKCERCGDVITGKEIPATGHTWKAATGYAPKTCEVCGITEGDVIKYISVSGDTVEWTEGDGSLTLTFKRSEQDELCFQNYKETLIDQNPVKVEAKAGSTVITIDEATLKTFAAGTHTITAVFADATSEVKLVIKEPAAEAPESPKTGDSLPGLPPAIVLLAAIAAASAIVVKRRFVVEK